MLYIVISGEIGILGRMIVEKKEKDELTLVKTVENGLYFGEFELTKNKNYFCTAKALLNTHLITIDKSDFYEYL